MTVVIDLNSDLGEQVGDDLAMFGVVSSANIACGFHAGDEATMRASLLGARERGVVVGAHPSYRDREGFGRRDVEIDPETLLSEVMLQVLTLQRVAEGEGVRVDYVKPHGALYNRIVTDADQAEAVVRACAALELPLLGLPGSVVERIAGEHGVRFVREGFADRGYLADGSLAPRGLPGAVLTDAAAVADRAARMVLAGEVVALDGSIVELGLDSLCVHGDTEGAVALALATRARLEAEGVVLQAFA